MNDVENGNEMVRTKGTIENVFQDNKEVSTHQLLMMGR